MVYTNGSIAAQCVFLSCHDEKENWKEVPVQEAASLLEAQEDDYLQALERFGVVI